MKTFLTFLIAITFTLGVTAQNKTEMKKTLVAYFSCTGNTKAAAQKIATYLGADLFEITPETPYTAADLDWRIENSRSTIEMKDKSSRPAISSKVADMAKYDQVYIGFPIWWYVAPTIINTFIESYDFTGKRLIPFATSGSSGIENCEKELSKSYPSLTWAKGKLLNGTINDNVLKGWAK